MKSESPIASAILFGLVAGIRSMAAPALLSQYAINHNDPLPKQAEFLRSGNTLTFFNSLLLAEMIGDKLPFASDRISKAPLAGRAITGGMVGGVYYSMKKQSFVKGAAIGSAAALVSSFAFFFLRKGISKGLKVPDFITALAEDALIIYAGSLFTNEKSQEPVLSKD